MPKLDPARFPPGATRIEQRVTHYLWLVRYPSGWRWAICEGWNDWGTRRVFADLGSVDDGLDAEAAAHIAAWWAWVDTEAPRQPDQTAPQAPIAPSGYLPPAPAARRGVVACLLPARA